MKYLLAFVVLMTLTVWGAKTMLQRGDEKLAAIETAAGPTAGAQQLYGMMPSGSYVAPEGSDGAISEISPAAGDK